MNGGNVVMRLCFSVLVVLVLMACSSGNTLIEEPADVQANTILHTDYRLGADDVVQVNVWHNPELSVSVPVRPDGKITVPLAGDVEAGGKTSNEVAEIIREKLAVYVRDPQVTVIVTQLRSHEFLTRVRITGAVRNPSSMPYRQGMTVLDAVLQAGGVNEFASPDRTELYRKKESKIVVYSVKLNQILQKGDLETNYNLQPGDVITVPERFF